MLTYVSITPQGDIHFFKMLTYLTPNKKANRLHQKSVKIQFQWYGEVRKIALIIM